MNKTAIKNFAIWARNKLISDINYRAGLLGITADYIHSALPQSTGQTQFYDIGTAEPYAITGEQIHQRQHLVDLLRQKEKESDYKTAYKYVLEEVAYTWFNRLIAVRFMEINDYLPSHIRILSSESGKMEPDLVTTPFDADLEFTRDEQQTILDLKSANKLDEVFRLLFIKQCNALNKILPALFEKTSDYTELLLNLSVIDQDGVVWHLVHDIPEADFNVEEGGQVEIIGWLYQYYNTEPKNEAFAKKGKITKDEIPAVTQLFTPDWIVRYMVENSLGRIYIDKRKNEGVFADGRAIEEMTWHEIEIKRIENEKYIADEMGWKYYLPEAEQEPEVAVQLSKIHKEYEKLNLEDIKVIDPCMGSGHILVYVFDVLMQIYESAGYGKRDAARSILENNIYGLDIDDRAFQMAYFAVMMKARQYNRRILNGEYMPNMYSIQESNGINRKQLKYFGKGLNELEKNNAINQITGLLDTFIDAKEYGSILNVDPCDWELLMMFVENINEPEQMDLEIDGIGETQERLNQIISQGKLLGQKYEVTVTNPPYMGSSSMSVKLTDFLKNRYNTSKGDLFAVFIERCLELERKNYYLSLITQQSWMFLSSYQKLRDTLTPIDLVTLLHLGAHAFEEQGGEVVQTVAFTLRKTHIEDYTSVCDRLVGEDNPQKKKIAFLNSSNRIFSRKTDFELIPAKPYAYWISKNALHNFTNKNLGSLAEIVSGMTTGNNDIYLKGWTEVSLEKIAFGYRDVSMIDLSNTNWIPYHKGGEMRKWYGNNEYVVNWARSKEFNRAKTTMTHVYLKPCITWSDISGNSFAGRYCSGGFMFDVKGSCAFANEDDLKYLIGIFNSKVTPVYVEALNPTTTTQVGDIKRIPLINADMQTKLEIRKLVDECISISKDEWDSFELSWDFSMHPFVRERAADTKGILLSDAFTIWEKECNERIRTLKSNEEKLNEIFISLYGLNGELNANVPETCITIRVANLQREIKSLLSYAVGCMFGRYSLDKKGIVYAGGSWDGNSDYASFLPDSDNVIPITDEEYLEDDVISRLSEWLRKVYGENTLEENLDFIACALNTKGDSSREIIRNYFVTEFMRDHIKVYQKRPIYWLFDSGKQNGFKALIYLHRYNADTIGILRIDYLHRMQRIYESEINRMQDMIDHSASAREAAQATKRQEKLTKQLKECREYDEKLAHLALSRIELDLDDGVKVNYRKLQTASDGKFYEVLADSKNIMSKK